ncbi:hypothetical protein M426DRAFT_9670 [Hypoxylon sp. CI-4A]|nr:hypothetical protein M426DRAFT_9670 [Hypoxylon sp. CI-4A]
MPFLDHSMGGESMQVDLDDVDDLFGDGAPLTLPSRPASKRLRQRLDNLRERGCCQTIAWSKSGTIASISPDGQQVQLRYIRANEKDATFSLSEPSPLSSWGTLPGGPLVHLTWSPVNSELAIIDAVGRLLILNFNTTLNRPTLSRRWDSDSLDDSQAIVGTYWLQNYPGPNPRMPPYTPSYAPAVKTGNSNNYHFQMTPIISTGPWHPQANKSALVSITRNGMLKLFWSQYNGKIEETTLELENSIYTDDLVTHAAVCSDRTKTLMVCMATASKQLRIVQVGLNWGTPKAEGAANAPPGNHPLNPTLSKRHLAVTSWFQPGSGDLHMDSSMSKITHIEMLPALLTSPQNKEWSPMIILTVRSFVPEQNSPYAQDTQSIIDRWELLSDQQQTVHSDIDQLGNRRNSVGSPPTNGSKLKKLDPVVVNKIVIGVNLVNFGKVLCFTYNDGSVEYRDRTTMDELHHDVNLDRIESVLDIGFSQSGEPSCLQVALSPTNFSLVQLCEDGQVKWHSIHYTLADIEAINDAQVSALVAGFTIATAQAASQGTQIDDILAVARNFANKDAFATEWVKTMVQMMKITVDYTEDTPHDHLIKNGILQMCLSITNYLGWRGDALPRQSWGKLSMIALNLRNTVIMITLSSNNITLNKTTLTPLDEPEVVNSLVGCVKWSTDLLAWLCDSLFCLFGDPKFMSLLKLPQSAPMTAYLNSQNEIALHLVLCSATRGLLSALCRRISLLDSFSTRAISWYETREKPNINNQNDPRAAAHAALYAAYQRMRRYTSSSLIKADDFDRLLTSLGADIRSAYSAALAGLEKPRSSNSQASQNQNASTQASQETIARGRQHCELGMLLLQAPPPFFVSVVDKFFNNDLKDFRANTDVAKLYFADYSLLEIDNEPQLLENRRARGIRVDLFKRVEISQKSSNTHNGTPLPWRACSRCASVMEDLAPVSTKPGISFLLRSHSNCSCGGRMAVLPQDEVKHN